MADRLTPYQAWLKSGLRQDHIAKEMGMNPTQLNHLLRERRPWNAKARADFCRITEVPEDRIEFTIPVAEQAAQWRSMAGMRRE